MRLYQAFRVQLFFDLLTKTCLVCHLTLISQGKEQWNGGRIRRELQVQSGTLTQQSTFGNVIQV